MLSVGRLFFEALTSTLVGFLLHRLVYILHL